MIARLLADEFNEQLFSIQAEKASYQSHGNLAFPISCIFFVSPPESVGIVSNRMYNDRCDVTDVARRDQREEKMQVTKNVEKREMLFLYLFCRVEREESVLEGIVVSRSLINFD